MGSGRVIHIGGRCVFTPRASFDASAAGYAAYHPSPTPRSDWAARSA